MTETPQETPTSVVLVVDVEASTTQEVRDIIAYELAPRTHPWQAYVLQKVAEGS